MDKKEMNSEALVELVDQVAELSTALEAAVAEVEDLKRVKAEEIKPEEEEKAAAHKHFKNILTKSHGQGELTLIDAGKIKIKAAGLGAEGNPKVGQDYDKHIIPQFVDTLLQRLREGSPTVADFSTANAANTDYSLPVEIGDFGASWDGTWNGDAAGVEWNKASFGKMTSAPVCSNDMIEDAFFAIEPWITASIADKFGRASALAFLHGTEAAKQPKGFLTYFDKTEGVKPVETRKIQNYAVATVQVSDTASVLDALFAMTVDLPLHHRAGAKWYMSREAYKMIGALRDADGHSFIQRDPNDANKFMLHGFAIVVDPTFKDTDPVVLGDLARAFQLLSMPSSLRMLRNPYKFFGSVAFPTEMRVGTITLDNTAARGLFIE